MRDAAPFPNDDDSDDVPGPDPGRPSGLSLLWILVAIIVFGVVVALHLTGTLGPNVH